MDDTAKKVALVARAIESAVRINVGIEYGGLDRVRFDPGIWEEAARQAIAAYLNAWRTTGRPKGERE